MPDPGDSEQNTSVLATLRNLEVEYTTPSACAACPPAPTAPPDPFPPKYQPAPSRRLSQTGTDSMRMIKKHASSPQLKFTFDPDSATATATSTAALPQPLCLSPVDETPGSVVQDRPALSPSEAEAAARGGAVATEGLPRLEPGLSPKSSRAEESGAADLRGSADAVKVARGDGVRHVGRLHRTIALDQDTFHPEVGDATALNTPHPASLTLRRNLWPCW